MPAALRRVATHQVGSSEAGVTLVTQCSLDRMNRLLPLLAAWDGPLVAAVLCFDGERSDRVPQRDGHSQLRALLAQVPTRHALCRIGLFVEDGLAEGPLGALYPINAMRNAAVGLATSALVLPLDIDFLPCAGLHASLARPDALAAARRACCEERWMLVLPALESVGDDACRAVELAAGGKVAVQRAVREGRASAFASDIFLPGHGATDTLRWLGVDAPYEVEHEEGCELATLLTSPHSVHLPRG